MTENKQFRIIAPIYKADLQKNWSYSDQNIKLLAEGIQLTRPQENFAGSLYFINAIDMNAEWEVELRFRIARKIKMKDPEKPKKNMKKLVDAISIQLTNEFIGTEYIAKNPQINIFGANFILLLSDSTNYLTFRHSGSNNVLPASYLEMLFNDIVSQREHTNFCQLPNIDVIKLRMQFNFQNRSLYIAYFNKTDEVWDSCMTIEYINRFIDSHYHHMTINGVSNIGTKTIITLEDATLAERKIKLGKDIEQK